MGGMWSRVEGKVMEGKEGSGEGGSDGGEELLIASCRGWT